MSDQDNKQEEQSRPKFAFDKDHPPITKFGKLPPPKPHSYRPHKSNVGLQNPPFENIGNHGLLGPGHRPTVDISKVEGEERHQSQNQNQDQSQTENQN